MEFEQILQLIRQVSDSKLDSFHYEEGDVKISMKCGKKVVSVPACVDKEDIEEIHVKKENPAGNIVKSPLVGTFYAAPGEEEEPFVQVGSVVEKGQVLAIVEAMKLMNEIESESAGRIVEIYVKNGETVEYGQPLFRIA